jgi:histidinol-phosphatase
VSDDLELAMTAATTGARLAMSYFDRIADVGRERKPDGSLVTEADRAVEAAVVGVLAGARPTDAILGEEGGQRGDDHRRWIVDPIDGTVSFAAGQDRWLVLVALESDGQVVVAVAAEPAQRRVWWAQRGAGACVADLADDGVTSGVERIQVHGGPTPDVAAARLGIVPGPLPLPSDAHVVERLTTVTAPQPWPHHPGLLVARGDLDLAVQTRGKVWDYAVPSLIVTEAGGCFSGLAGQEHPHHGPALYSRDPDLHRAALAYLA